MSTTTTLTDRYVWAVSRQLPKESGPDVARELRGTLADTIEDKVAAGADPEQAERQAITELGDPDVLARDYGGRPNHLIGPDLYADWVRLVRFLLSVVLPIGVVAAVGTQALATDKHAGALIGEGVVVGLHIAVHLVFWSTLVFALVERHGSSAERASLVSGWDPSALADPETPWRRVDFREIAMDIVFGVVVTLIVVWQFGGVGPRGIQVLDPDLALVWQASIVALLVAEIALTALTWTMRGWGIALSAAHATVNIALAVVLVGLVLANRLLTDLPQVLGEKFGWHTDWSVSTPAVVLGIVVVCGWDVVSSLVRLVRSVRVRRHREAGQ